MQILKLELQSNGLAETERFYHDILGLQISAKSKSEISFLTGTTNLVFKYVEGLKPVYHLAFNIPCNQLDDAIQWAEKKVDLIDVTPGIKIADFVNWNAKSIYFYDYNGNILEFIARFELNNKSEEVFNSNSVLCVSEIGLATHDIAATCNELSAKFGLALFSKQPRMPNFAAIGDEDGLLILSLDNRCWYPTQHTATKYPTRIEIKHNNKTQQLEFNVANWQIV